MLQRARCDNLIWGSGLRPPVYKSERHIVTPETFAHLRDWVFNTNFLEPLKASEQNTQRGHCFAIRESLSTTYVRYKENATQAKVDPVSDRVYRYET